MIEKRTDSTVGCTAYSIFAPFVPKVCSNEGALSNLDDSHIYAKLLAIRTCYIRKYIVILEKKCKMISGKLSGLVAGITRLISVSALVTLIRTSHSYVFSSRRFLVLV